MKRRAFVLHLGTGGMVGLGSCATLPGSYSIDTPTEAVCDRESTVTHTVQQFAVPTDIGPDHWSQSESSVGHLDFFGSAEAARADLPLERVPSGRRDAVESFIEDTYFRNAMLLYVASVGPSDAYDTIRLCGLRTEDEAILGRAVVPAREEANTDVEGESAYPSALVRVVTGEPRPIEARLTIESAAGSREEFTARRD
jgi:hypothetical protein